MEETAKDKQLKKQEEDISKQLEELQQKHLGVMQEQKEEAARKAEKAAKPEPTQLPAPEKPAFGGKPEIANPIANAPEPKK